MTPADRELSPPPAAPARSDAGLELTIRGAQRRFGDVRVLDRLDLDVPAGQFLALLGPSGCGKSTLLRLVAALDEATLGTLAVGGKLIDKHRRKRRHPAADAIAFVFQEAHLLPWRTLVRNVELPLELAGVDKATRRDKARALIEQVGLGDAIHRYPAQLSGGMRMRASLARALVTDPKLLLLDEPFAALDEITRQRLDGLLHQLWRERRFTVLFVTHAISEALFLAQRAIMFSARPARIIADRPVTLPEERTMDTRATAPFAQLERALYQDLLVAEQAGAPPEPGPDMTRT